MEVRKITYFLLKLTYPRRDHWCNLHSDSSICIFCLLESVIVTPSTNFILAPSSKISLTSLPVQLSVESDPRAANGLQDSPSNYKAAMTTLAIMIQLYLIQFLVSYVVHMYLVRVDIRLQHRQTV